MIPAPKDDVPSWNCRCHPRRDFREAPMQDRVILEDGNRPVSLGASSPKREMRTRATQGGERVGILRADHALFEQRRPRYISRPDCLEATRHDAMRVFRLEAVKTIWPIGKIDDPRIANRRYLTLLAHRRDPRNAPRTYQYRYKQKVNDVWLAQAWKGSAKASSSWARHGIHRTTRAGSQVSRATSD
jgi:hypothetical protein